MDVWHPTVHAIWCFEPISLSSHPGDTRAGLSGARWPRGWQLGARHCARAPGRDADSAPQALLRANPSSTSAGKVAAMTPTELSTHCLAITRH